MYNVCLWLAVPTPPAQCAITSSWPPLLFIVFCVRAPGQYREKPVSQRRANNQLYLIQGHGVVRVIIN